MTERKTIQLKNQVTISEVTVSLSKDTRDAFGTGCLGYLPEGTTYKQIVSVLGRPNVGASGDGKVKCEWVGKVNGLVFTIYDYKSSVAKTKNTDWHIGGKNPLIANLIANLF